MTLPLEIVFDTQLRCTVCRAPRSLGCDCWTKCQQPGCKWLYRTGMTCRNPDHAKPTPEAAR